MPETLEATPLAYDSRRLRNGTKSWWFRDKGLRRLAIPISVGFASTISSGYDGSLMTGLQANHGFMDALGNPNGNKLGIIVGS